MKNKISSLLIGVTLGMTAIPGLVAFADDDVREQPKAPDVPEVVHSRKGDTSGGVEGRLLITNIGKKQYYAGATDGSLDRDIVSPKSAIFSPDGKRVYVHSLEGCKTVVYDAATLEKKAVVNHTYGKESRNKFAPLSGYYSFIHYPDREFSPFSGKPVESVWSHNGRYLWVPFYRRSFDINAQDPSAIAVIDARADTVVRVFETGPLPKMVAVSNKGNLLAITHWGDNTVGFIDIGSPNPDGWHHLPPVEIGRRLTLDYPLDQPVNRDANSGNLLRGTVFTPDDRYLLVGGMAGPLQVLDMTEMRHIGNVGALYGVRHLDIHGDRLYASQNIASTVLSLNVDSLTASIYAAKENKSRLIPAGGKIRTAKVGRGARTISVSPDGEFIFAACNGASKVYVVDAATMQVADTIRCDSYPVGLAVSPDGTMMAVTSQGRERRGGNAVNFFRIERFGSVPTPTVVQETVAEEPDSLTADTVVARERLPRRIFGLAYDSAIVCGAAIVAGVTILIVCLILFRRKKKRRTPIIL